jgi:hypothetical protein
MKMKSDGMSQIASPELIKKGWELLIKELGVNGATRFVVALERGEGDTILEVEKYWGDASVDEIYEQILEAKEQGELQI